MHVDWNAASALLLRIGIAALLGGLIGLERERAGRNAGLRTHILISLGAALVMCTGEYIFTAYSGESSIDPARLGAQVVSGIGVLCAGTIMKEGSAVKGLTTATGLWCAACIGLAAGSGNIIPAAGVTVTALVVLRFFRYLEERRRYKSETAELRIVMESGEAAGQVIAWMKAKHYQIDAFRMERGLNGQVTLACSATHPQKQDHSELIAGLAGLDTVLGAESVSRE